MASFSEKAIWSFPKEAGTPSWDVLLRELYDGFRISGRSVRVFRVTSGYTREWKKKMETSESFRVPNPKP